MKTKILVFDNYDSFTYNLTHMIKSLGYTDVEVHRNDKITSQEINRFDKIILSPGPGIPSESGPLLPLIKEFAGKKSILGICLGHQAIGEAFNAKLNNVDEVHHGIASEIEIIGQDYIFDSLDFKLTVGRYHSWIVSTEKFPDCLDVTAVDSNGQIMALRHKEYDIHGIQFHPESILTPMGEVILRNFLFKNDNW